MNIAANVVSPANDFSNLAPSKISFRTGGLITGVLATLMMPWKLLENATATSTAGCSATRAAWAPSPGCSSATTGSSARRASRWPTLPARRGLRLRLALGTNWAAVVATAAGCAVAWIGLFVPALHWLYDAAWFSGTLTSALVYGVWMRGAREG